MSTLERLEGIREEIAGMGKAVYGCRAVKYSSVRIIKSVVEEDGFQAFILIGGKGHGKSTYSIKTVAFYFMVYEGMDCGEAYLAALDRIAFTAEELLDKIEQFGDIVIWDDAGLHGSTYFWFDDAGQEYLRALADWYDVARTDIKALIMSTPSKRKLPPIIRTDPEALLVVVRKHGIKQVEGIGRIRTSVARAARNIEPLFTDRTYREEVYRDVFTVWLPTPVYNYYQVLRQRYSVAARRRLRDVLQRRKDELEIHYYDE